MPKLHLVGITPDNRGLLLSEHARAKRGDLVLEIDDKLLEAIDRANRQLHKDEGRGLESAALPSKREDVGDGTSSGRLSPREIQHRLRLGESVSGLAKASGTDEAWIDRFAAPVLAEQARVVERATAKVYTKPRVGPSAVPLGQSVAANVFEKGAALTLDEIDEGWGAHMRPEGVWCVTFSFSHKGRRHLAEWDVDPSTSELTARNKLGGELGYRESGRRVRAPEAGPAQPAEARPAPVKKTVVKKPAASRAAGRPAPGKRRAGARPVPQTLPGTSTESSAASGGVSGPPSAPAPAAPATPEPPSPAPPTPGPPSPAAPEPSGSIAPAPPASGAAPPLTPEPVEPPASGPTGSPAERPSRTGGGRDPLGRRALFSPPPETGVPAADPEGTTAPGSAGPPAAAPADSPAEYAPTAGAVDAISLARRPAPMMTPPAAEKPAPAKKAAPAKGAAPAKQAAPPVQHAAPSPESPAAPPVSPGPSDSPAVPPVSPGPSDSPAVPPGSPTPPESPAPPPGSPSPVPPPAGPAESGEVSRPDQASGPEPAG